jgi:DNA-binding transcriptional ArsR family regulator
MEEHNDVLVSFARALGDPLRLLILDFLSERAATVSELQAFTGEGQSKISNHLALLREGGLVEARRRGRQMVYQLRSAEVAQLVQAMRRIGMRRLTERQWKSPEMLFARTCHDHLGGIVGTAVLDALRKQGVVTMTDGVVQAGPAGREFLERLGIDVEEVKRERRQFMTACPDCGGGFHLGGALGAALTLRMMELGWFTRPVRSGKQLQVTDKGQHALRELLDIDVDALAQTLVTV